MPSSDRKKLSIPKKYSGVSVKRKSSTSPSLLYKSPSTKKKIQPNSTTIKTPLRSYNLRNSHLSKPVPDHEVPKFYSPPIKPKDQKQLEGSLKKASNRCLWCSHFIPADSADFICFSCHFKDSESRAYYGSRRPRSVTRRSSDEPEVIAIIPASPQRKEVSVVNRRNRRKRRPPQKYTPPSINGKQTANGRQSINGGQSPNGKQISNGEASVPLTAIASKLISGVAKPVKVKMASKGDGNGKQSVKGEQSLNGKQIANGKRITNGEASVPLTLVASKLTSGVAKPINVKMSSKEDGKHKRIKVSSPKSSKRARCEVAKEIEEMSDERDLNSKSSKPAVTRSKRLKSHLSKPVPGNEAPKLDSPSIISEHHKQPVSSAKKAFNRCLWCSVFIPADSDNCICINCQLKDSGIQGIRRSLFQSTEAISKKQRSTDSSDNDVERPSDNHTKQKISDNQILSLNNHVKEARTKDPKKTAKSPKVKRKRRTYDCGRCDRSFRQRQQFRIHDRSCSEMVSVEEDSESTLSNYSVSGFGVHPVDSVINDSGTVEKNATIRLDNAPSESKDEESEEMSSESADALSAQEKISENHSPFHEVITNEESFCLPDTQGSFNTAEPISEETVCFDTIETFQEVQTSSLDINKTSLETIEQHSNSKDLCLDAIEPSLDSNYPSLDVDESSSDDTEPTFEPYLACSEKSSEPTLDGTEQSSNPTEVSVDTTGPTNTKEHILDANEPTLDVNEPTLDANEPTSDVNGPPLDANELFLNAIDISLTQPSSKATEPSCSSSAEHSLDAIEPSLHTSGSCLYLEESFLNPEVSNLGATVQISDTNDNNVVENCLGIVESSLDAIQSSSDITRLPSLDAPSLDTNEFYLEQNPKATPLNVNEDAIDSCTIVAKSDLNTTQLHLDASKTESAVDEKNNTQLNLDGLETSLQLQNCHLEGGWKTRFKEPGPSLEKLATSSKVPEGSLQGFQAFFKGRCDSKNMESSVECTSTLHDPKINLEELKETQVILHDKKSSVEVGSSAAKSESNENKTTLKEAEAIVEGSLKMVSNLGGEPLASKVTELNLEPKISNLKGQESSLNGVECTLKQKEYCATEVESQDQIEEIDISQDDFCIQITNVCSLLDNSKVVPEAKEDVTPCSVTKPFTNDCKADSPRRNNNTLRSERLSRQVPPPPKWENSGLRKGKRKPEDSVKGKEPVWLHSLPPSPNKSHNGSGMLNGIHSHQPLPLNRNLDSNGISQGCHSCGRPLSFPAPSNSKTKAEVLDRNLCFSSETTCWFCSADQKIQFSLPTKALDNMFGYHMSSFVGRMERMTQRNFKQVPFHLLASVQQADASSNFGSRTLNSTGSENSSSVDSQRIPSCTYPSCTPPPSPYSCPGSVAAQEVVQEEVQPVQEEVQHVQEVLPPREIELTEHNFPDEPDIVKKRTEDTYTCTRFKSKSCVLPLQRTDIYTHYFNVHNSPADRTTFNVLYVDE